MKLAFLCCSLLLILRFHYHEVHDIVVVIIVAIIDHVQEVVVAITDTPNLRSKFLSERNTV